MSGDDTSLDPPAARRAWRQSATLVELAPLSLVVLAEAAWLSALAGLIQALSARPPEIGIFAFAAFVSLGTLAARLLSGRIGERWPMVVPGLVAIGVVAGTLYSEAARTSLGSGLAAVITAHPAGWVAGLAVLRGVAHARLPIPEDSIARLLTVGIPGLAIIATAGAAVPEPYRAAFQADVMAAVVVFVVAATLALALTRLTAIGHDGGFDWRRNPAWIALVVVILALAIAATLSLTSVGASLIQVAAGLTVGVLLVIALSAGLDRGAIRVLLGLIVFQVVIYLLVARLGTGGTLPQVLEPGGGTGGDSDASTALTIGLGGVVLLAAIIAIVVLATIWMRRIRPPIDDPVQESRTIDRGAVEDRPRPGRRRNRARRRDPQDATAAYVALVEDLERHPAVRRDPAETPAEHAARLRREGRSGLMLDLLAADYALVRFGGTKLSPGEHRRALSRWKLLRRQIPKERA